MTGSKFSLSTILFALAFIAPIAVPIDAAAQGSNTDTTVKDIPSAPLDIDLETYVLGNTFVTIYHELGHALIDFKEIPVLGREEDAVDAFALVELITQIRSPETGIEADNRLVKYGYASIDHWLKLAMEENPPLRETHYGPHSLDRQRMFSTACLLLGGSATEFKQASEIFDIPDTYLLDCKASFFDAYDSWFYMLDRFGGFETNGTGIRGESKTAYHENTHDLIFDIKTPAHPDHQRWERLIRGWQGIDEIQQHFSNSFSIDRPIQITFETCGEENAYYFPTDQSISLCYELMGAYARLHGKHVSP